MKMKARNDLLAICINNAKDITNELVVWYRYKLIN